MIQISKQQIEDIFSYKEFLPYLQSFLTKEVSSPDRSHFDIPVSNNKNATLLTMPAWSVDEYIGVKIVNVFPDNKTSPTINGSYLLMSGKTGELLCIIDGLSLTIKRTASISALASQLLSNPAAKTFLVLGTGNLSTEFIKAHSTVRSFSDIYIWGRNFEKAEQKASLFKRKLSVKAVKEKEKYFSKADIISSVTLSENPIIFGNQCKSNVYFDLVGSFQKHSREADDDCLKNATIFVDTFKAAKESGDLFIPIENGLIKLEDIQSDLVELCRNGRKEASFGDSKTFFKSVGFAAPDLALAVYLYGKMGQK